mgnify:CR=1 FL=1
MSVAQYGLLGTVICAVWFGAIVVFALWGHEREH